MAYDIIIGRTQADANRLGKRGTILLGRQYVQMGQTSSLSNDIMMDVTRSHVVFVCGKRGSGKSYTLGVIAEGMANLEPDVSKNLAVIILDTMGIFWTMRYANLAEADLLKEWGMEGKSLQVAIFTPEGSFKSYKDRGIPTDFPFSIKSNELSAVDWCRTLGVNINDPIGVLIDRAVEFLVDKGGDFGIDDIIGFAEKDEFSEKHEKNAVINKLAAAKKWGLFSDKGTSIQSLVKGGQVTVLDLSCYAMTPGAEGLRALAIGLISQKLFVSRMVARKAEEIASIEKNVHYVEEELPSSVEEPLVWLLIDEAHEFLPNRGETAASNALITILREGRQPGISLVLASQQPGKIHSDVMTQADIVISHRITAKMDVDALGTLMQSYMREGLDKQINILPKVRGAAVIFDDTNERMHSMRIRPRLTWHGGEAPDAMGNKVEL
ncbi:ATP-binding protein [Candidatus Woesearchaeota archaeon]|nr:ATP-binding protein [Candidatus Woesearchaeota archaeon]